MYEFDLIVGVDNSFDVFSEAWALWEPAILEYSAAPLSKSKTLKQALRDIDSDDTGNLMYSKFNCRFILFPHILRSP